MVARALIGTLMISIRFFALHHMPLADVAMINASSALFVNIQARIFLKEPIQLFNIFNVCLVLGGLVLIVRPPFLFGDNEFYLKDPQALTAAILSILASVIVNPLSAVVLRALKGGK